MSAEIEYQHVDLTVYTDGTIQREAWDPPPLPACPSPADPLHVATKDITLNASLATSARLFLPPLPRSHSKLPILLYFHGGAFLHFITAVFPYHTFLSFLASHCNLLIVSVDYRLAPEHPLPAAYDDGFHALLWLNKQAALGAAADPWLAGHADFSQCFIGGDSAGGTITHYVAMQAAGHGSWEVQQKGSNAALKHVNLQGLLLFHPFFTCGRAEGAPAGPLKSKVLKYMNVKQEDPLIDPLSPASPSLESAPLPRIIVFVAGLDPMLKCGEAYYQSLVKAGKRAKLFLTENDYHLFHIFDPKSPNLCSLLNEVKDFIYTHPKLQQSSALVTSFNIL